MMDDAEKKHAAALIVSLGDKPEHVEPDGDEGPPEDSEPSDEEVLAARAVKQALTKGDDKEFAVALKSFMSLCDYD
jgi:hypothetical protein